MFLCVIYSIDQGPGIKGRSQQNFLRFFSRAARLVRRVAPTFSIPPPPVTEVRSGGSLNLTCVAVGSPMPYVKWKKGPSTDLTPDDNLPVGRNVLTLTNVKESANYTCTAASDLGIIEVTTMVKVQGSYHRIACHRAQYCRFASSTYAYSIIARYRVASYRIVSRWIEIARKSSGDRAGDLSNVRNAKRSIKRSACATVCSNERHTQSTNRGGIDSVTNQSAYAVQPYFVKIGETWETREEPIAMRFAKLARFKGQAGAQSIRQRARRYMHRYSFDNSRKLLSRTWMSSPKTDSIKRKKKKKKKKKLRKLARNE